MNTLLSNWTFMRALRVIMGVIAFGQAFVMQDWILGIAGALLLVMGIFNIGCCGINGCGVNYRAKTTIRENEFEEVTNN
jgi:hypothetical protein